VELFLRRYDGAKFEIVWRDGGAAALREFDKGSTCDIILMDYFLPGQNGLEVTRALQEKGVTVPIIFLTVNKDFDLAVEAMKLGIDDYLVKEEVTTPILPKTILDVLERRKLKEELAAAEVARKRMEAIQEMVVRIASEMKLPLERMRASVERVVSVAGEASSKPYLTIITENVARIERKMARLKELKTDKTIPYVRDIKMFDLSDGDKK